MGIKQYTQNYWQVAVAFVVSVNAFLLIYLQYFQSYGLSIKRAFAGGVFIVIFSILIFLIIRYFVRKLFFDEPRQALKLLAFWMLVAFLFSPSFFPIPHYPFSPLFQSFSRLTILVQTSDGIIDAVQLKGVWLRFDNKEYSYKDFSYSDEWVIEADRYFMKANSHAEIRWQGRIGERAVLTIFPMDKETQITVRWDGEESTEILKDKPIVINKLNRASIWYYILIVLVKTVCLGFGIFFLLGVYQSLNVSRTRAVMTIAFFAFLTAYTVYAQFENPEIKGRLEELQVSRHAAVIAGTAPNPWQYRVFAEWLISGMVSLVSLFGLSDPYFGVFALVRILQNAAIFILAYLYFRKLGYSEQASLLGIVFTAGALLNSFHQSDLSFNTYFDVIFYLGASLLILNDSHIWLPALMVAASLNRETSGLIPFLALSTLRGIRNWYSKFVFIILSLAVWGIVFVLLHIYRPENELFLPYGYYPGISLLGYNLTSFSLGMLLRFISFTFFVGLFFYKQWSPILKGFFIALVPVWFLIHFFGSVISETRLFLVPQLLVFIPAFLIFVERKLNRQILAGMSH